MQHHGLLSSIIGIERDDATIVAEFEVAFNTAADLPDEVQWYEGMWLAPEILRAGSPEHRCRNFATPPLK